MRLRTISLFLVLLLATPLVFANILLDYPTQRTNVLEGGNLITDPYFTDVFAWTQTNATLTPESKKGPNGRFDAAVLTEDTTAADIHSMTWPHSKAASAITYKFSVYLKRHKGTRNYTILVLNGDFAAGGSMVVDLGSGSVLTAPNTFGGFTGENGRVIHKGNGWYFVEFGFTTDAVADLYLLPRLTENSSASYDGDGVSSVAFWGAHLKQL